MGSLFSAVFFADQPLDVFWLFRLPTGTATGEREEIGGIPDAGIAQYPLLRVSNSVRHFILGSQRATPFRVFFELPLFGVDHLSSRSRSDDNRDQFASGDRCSHAHHRRHSRTSNTLSTKTINMVNQKYDTMNNMKKLAFFVIVAVGLVVVWWLASPLFLNSEVSEDMPVAPMGEVIQMMRSGTFEGLEFHHAEGTATLIQSGDQWYVRFEDDFMVTNGPDLFVHFGKDGAYVAEARLGKLKGNIGSQNYLVPEGINPEDFNEVWIWCRAFSVPFGKALLQ